MASEDRWLTDAQHDAWMAYVAVTALLDGTLDRQLQRDSGLPHAYYQILAMLSDVPGRTLRMSDLAEITQSSQSRLSHAVARLERNGWIRRVPCPDDRRSTLAQLTEAGFAVLADAAPGHVDTVRRHLFGPLSDEQVGQLTTILRAVLAGLDGAGACPATSQGGDRHSGSHGNPGAAPSRAEHVERREPVHRLGGRAAVGDR